jgi:LytTr DNA-binding domain-containing protein
MTHTRVAIKSRGRILIIDTSEIMAIEAQGNYVLVQRASGSDMLRMSISTVENELADYGFLRIHRSVVLNSAWVEEIRPGCGRDWVLRVRGGKQYTVGRSYRRNLRLLAQSWLGVEGATITEEMPAIVSGKDVLGRGQAAALRLCSDAGRKRPELSRSI